MASVNQLSSNSASAFKYANVIVGAIMMIVAVSAIVPGSPPTMISVYTAVFATIVIGMELYPLQSKHQKFLFRYAGFLYSLAGRGVFYILVGLLMRIVSYFSFHTFLGVVVAVVGFAYIALRIVGDPDLPPSMIPPDSIHGDVAEFHASQED